MPLPSSLIICASPRPAEALAAATAIMTDRKSTKLLDSAMELGDHLCDLMRRDDPDDAAYLYQAYKASVAALWLSHRELLREYHELCGALWLSGEFTLADLEQLRDSTNSCVDRIRQTAELVEAVLDPPCQGEA